ncbi:hypothetical protein Acid345_3302 [Candidatus Koribacter versatilis Ellin345]|uniref:YD repeat protein n=2 Tax=Candidatus Korobacter versatilis TaxID=658062 RepID=Q1ILE7_KORVE|nr:hypothetical protein Acid345_3302 [Candidatus Koribacter versatilis Ellin345]
MLLTRSIRMPFARSSQAVALAVLATSLSASLLCAQEFSLPAPDLNLRGRVAAINLTIESQDAGASRAERLEFQNDGKLSAVKVTRSGAPVSSVRYEYSRYALAKRQLNAEAFTPKKAILFHENGAFQGVAISENGANMVCDRVFDSMSASPDPVSRDICLTANGNQDLNEITKLDPDDSNVSVTRLSFGDQLRASWWIQRDKKGRVLIDHLAYTDLSFDRRFHHRDGSVEERSFRSGSNQYTVRTWDPAGKLLRVVTSLPNHPAEEQRFSYDSNGRLTHLATAGSVRHEIDFAYVDDGQGNWTERRATENGAQVEVVTRNIEYRGNSPSGNKH